LTENCHNLAAKDSENLNLESSVNGIEIARHQITRRICMSTIQSTQLNTLNQYNTVFDSPQALENWSSLHIEGWPNRWHELRFEEENGQRYLLIEPKVSSWYEDIIGGFLYQSITGDFEATARVKASGRKESTPTRSFSLGGLMVRTPHEVNANNFEQGKENWLFLTTGTVDRPGEPQFEVKTTMNSVSTLRSYPAQQGWVDLRIVRLRELFTLLYRYDGEAWAYLDQWVRPDLPQTVQVGLIAYTDWDGAAEVYPDMEAINKGQIPNGVEDLTLRVASIQFREPGIKRFGTELTSFSSIGGDKIAAFSRD
jgi:hypothetical protein